MTSLQLQAVHDGLNAHRRSRHSNHVLPFLCRAIKVEFEGEPGEGSGVVRSFLAAVCTALLEPLALTEPAAPSATGGPAPPSRTLTVADIVPVDVEMEGDADAGSAGAAVTVAVPDARPLFHPPGKPG